MTKQEVIDMLKNKFCRECNWACNLCQAITYWNKCVSLQDCKQCPDKLDPNEPADRCLIRDLRKKWGTELKEPSCKYFLNKTQAEHNITMTMKQWKKYVDEGVHNGPTS